MGDNLTKREKEVYWYLVHTRLNKAEIAKKMGVTFATISSHILNIYLKKMVNSRWELIFSHYENLINER